MMRWLKGTGIKEQEYFLGFENGAWGEVLVRQRHRKFAD